MSNYPLGAIYDQLDQFRGALLRNERRVSSAMVREYGAIWSTINRRISDLIAEYNRSGGQATGVTWAFQFQRLTMLQKQVEAQLLKFADHAEAAIIEQQRQAIAMARQHAEQMVLAGLGPLPAGIAPGQVAVVAGFNRLPEEAFTNLVGVLQDGSPLHSLLSKLPGDGGKIVADGLLEGLSLGQGARQIASNIRKGLGQNLSRAMRISRTETLRAYREATHTVYQANMDLVEKWIWRSARNVRTCAACWALDGSEHELSERLDGHVNCRCFAVPRTVTWKDLGYDIPEMVQEKAPGVDAFDKLSESDQLAVLGPAKYRAYSAGKITLPDLVGRRWDPAWGPMRYEKSLREVLSNGAREFYKKK